MVKVAAMTRLRAINNLVAQNRETRSAAILNDLTRNRLCRTHPAGKSAAPVMSYRGGNDPHFGE
jgi:hypothetical protein